MPQINQITGRISPIGFMFFGCRDAYKTLARSLRSRLPAAQQTRSATTTRAVSSMFQAKTPLAEKIAETGIWSTTRGKKKKGSITGDKHRVNIVSETLCDDVMKFLGPSLDRHRGCDLVDINPGSGAWSRKLHKVLKPRKHVMMEKDADLYSPFLKDLLKKKNVQLVPQSGIVWKNLNEMLQTHLPDQTPHQPGDTPQRNDTLLVSVNLAMYPRKPFQMFDCVSSLVLYQFMSSIRTSSLFQRYGVVRMLIWVNDEGKRKLLPRSIVRRRRSAFEAELSCDWIHEIAGSDQDAELRTELRDHWINVESGYKVLERMKQAGLTMPKGRETKMYLDLMANQELAGEPLVGVRRPQLNRPFKQELEELEEEFKNSKEEVVPARLKGLRFRDKYYTDDANTYYQLLQERDHIIALYQAGNYKKVVLADQAWNKKLGNMKKNPHNEFIGIRDNLHLYRQEPPALLWDRRPFEPLDVKPEDFFPNSPLSLLDLQPKAMSPLFREQASNSNSLVGHFSDVMLRYWFAHSLLPVSRAMDGVWPGFGDIAAEIPSLRDPAQGGIPMTGMGEMTARTINEKQWVDIMRAFMDWPFRPKYSQLVSRLVDDHDPDADDEEVKSGAGGSGLT